MSYSTKRIFSILFSLLVGLALCLGLAPDAAAADEWESFLDGVAQIQRLAEEYAGEPGEEALLLTLNYLRAERYADMEWDLVLGAAGRRICRPWWTAGTRNWPDCSKRSC